MTGFAEIEQFSEILIDSSITNHAIDILCALSHENTTFCQTIFEYLLKLSKNSSNCITLYKFGLINVIESIIQSDCPIESIKSLIDFCSKYFPVLFQENAPMTESIRIVRLLERIFDQANELESPQKSFIIQNTILTIIRCSENQTVSKLILTTGITAKIPENICKFNRTSQLYSILVLNNAFRHKELENHLTKLANLIDIQIFDNLLLELDDEIQSEILKLFSYLFKYVDGLADEQVKSPSFINIMSSNSSFSFQFKQNLIKAMRSGFMNSNDIGSKRLWSMNDLFEEEIQNICTVLIDDQENVDDIKFIQEVFETCDDNSELSDIIYPLVEQKIINDRKPYSFNFCSNTIE